MKMKQTIAIFAGLVILAGFGLAHANHENIMTADHPLYGAKMAGEEGVEELAPNASAEAKAKIKHAGKRANETENLVDENKTELANETANAYAEEMKEVNDLGKQISSLAQQKKFDELVATATMHHAEVLGKVYERVPEQAKGAISRALNKSARGHEKAVAAMENRGQSTRGMGNITAQIPANARDRNQARGSSMRGDKAGNQTSGADNQPSDTGSGSTQGSQGSPSGVSGNPQ